MFRVAALKSAACALLGVSTTLCNEQPEPGVGLLSGYEINATFETTAPRFYSRNMDIMSTKKVLNNRYQIYNVVNASRMSAEMVTSIASQAANFATSDELYDRTELRTYMEGIVSEPAGSFVCLLGGKSTGKSKLVKIFSERHAGAVLAVDCRNNPNIVAGLLATVAQKDATNMAKLQKVLHGLAMDAAASSGFSNSFAALYPPAQRSLAVVLNLIVENVKGDVTIIVDEANCALATEGTEENVSATRQALALFTRLTKQERKVGYYLDCRLVGYWSDALFSCYTVKRDPGKLGAHVPF
jgi:ABC-type cobalamin/Fe3+-siderophores transport system ATPase subunit